MPQHHGKGDTSLKVLHLSTFDNSGGAAKAANRLHKGLVAQHIQSQMLVQVKKGDDWRITRPLNKIVRGTGLFRPLFDSFPLFLYPHRSAGIFSPATTPDFLQPEIESISPDIINLHWIGYGFIRLETLKKITQPIVWTFHDMWPFTGGCHVDKNCGRYVQECGTCPQLGSSKQHDLSHRTWRRKLSAIKNLDINVVTPSNWLAECARKSSLFKDHRVCVIPNGINLDCFKPVSKATARNLWNLPQNKKIILFGSINPAGDRNKGYHLIQEALRLLKHTEFDKEIEVAIFGADEPKEAPELGLKSRYLGQLQDEISLATLYSAADVTVVPSLQEAFGQTASEALACGCPVVAFKTTGLIDIINHHRNGYLALPYEPSDLAKGIQWVLEDQNRYTELSAAARQKALKEYDVQKVASQYVNLYKEILSR